MRHKVKLKKLSKPTDQRLALLNSGVSSLIQHGRVKTTLTRAKEFKKIVEKLITLAKKGQVHSRREAYKKLGDRDIVKTLFDMAPRFADRPGGYTRIIKIGNRKGDNAPLALIEFVA